MNKFFIIIIGIIFIATGGFMYFRNNNLIKNCTVEATATVVDMKEELSTDSDTLSYMYYPIIEYIAGEETVKVTLDHGSNTPAYNINEKITILYNPNNAKEFLVKGDKSSNIFSIVFIVIGLFVTGYGIKVSLSKNQ